MHYRKSAISIIFFMLVTAVSPVFSQLNKPDLPEFSGEHIHLYADRNLYCVGENIQFSALYSTSDMGDLLFSKVLYVELIGWNGRKINAIKVPIENSIGSGSLKIPAELSSGNYYLRCYTKWMRNYSPYLYAYSPVKIINPFSTEIDKGEAGNSILRLEEDNTLPSGEGIVLSGLPAEAGCREELSFDLILKDKHFAGTYVVSISPDVENSNSIPSPVLPAGINDESGMEEIKFLPENNSITLDGRAFLGTDQSPATGLDVVLCSTIDPFYFFISSTDEDGYFYFNIPSNTGAHQFCITPLYETVEDIQLLIENGYCTREIELPYIPFTLEENEMKVAEQISINAQLQQFYSGPDTIGPVFRLPFYGAPTNTVYVDKYIQLGSLKEFIFELVPDLNIAGRNNESYLVFEQRSNLSSYPPLVLLDNIPVPNNNELLSIPSSYFDRIEVVSGGYLINTSMFSGLVCIFSRAEDSGNLDIQQQNQYFELQLFPHDDHSAPLESPRIADARNLLYFNPGLELDGTTPQTIRFTTGDAKGKYTVKIRGLSENGNPVLFEPFSFTVK